MTEENGNIIAKSVAADVSFGCQVEYSRIRLGGEPWHTIGLEWFGAHRLSLDSRIISRFFGDTEFQMQQSQGYAAFLKRFAHGRQRNLISP